MRTVRLVLAVLLIAAFFVLIAYPAFADAVYHSEHRALAPEAGFPLRTGFVQNIHVNGPNVFAHENYVLNGALPNTKFDVVFLVYLAPDCSSDPVDSLGTGSVSTNVAGNGKAQVVIGPGSVPHNMTIGGRWELWLDQTLAYSTQCTTIVLD